MGHPATLSSMSCRRAQVQPLFASGTWQRAGRLGRAERFGLASFAAERGGTMGVGACRVLEYP